MDSQANMANAMWQVKQQQLSVPCVLYNSDHGAAIASHSVLKDCLSHTLLLICACYAIVQHCSA
jgi:hypothetical protein